MATLCGFCMAQRDMTLCVTYERDIVWFLMTLLILYFRLRHSPTMRRAYNLETEKVSSTESESELRDRQTDSDSDERVESDGEGGIRRRKRRKPLDMVSNKLFVCNISILFKRS